ncbi:hypothetical protein KOR34_13240 [Posidoniimonas corsicana]|uniref:Tetratricopeptide repeat protein n=1 Tax=Posidoniimonas corsicana TaxID=1938618 RepID=A0A5C5VEU6_9BACT|nr:hypothetical protein [Posidoniimonas corsicana]TWT36419.1 hypothetical protein KOR34_13240 [Posidoniimonas corsicana]
MSHRCWVLVSLAVCSVLVVPAGPACADLPDDRVVAVRRTPIDRPAESRAGKSLFRDSLYNELARQTVLLSAREEFGLATRDGSFFEEAKSDSPRTFGAWIDLWIGDAAELSVQQGGAEVLRETLPVEYEKVRTYLTLAVELEELSRGPVAEMLAEAGYQRRPNQVVDSAPLPDGAAEALLQMNHLSQWRGLRLVHGAIRESGESPERLAALAQGYANLSQLYTPLLDLRTNACRARSLLYSQRLAARWPDSTHGKWRRAYALVMIGIVQSGHETAREIERAERADDDPPPWAPMLEEYRKYNTAALRDRFRDVESPLSSLAGALWCRAVQQHDCEGLTLQACREQLSVHPDGLWMMDVLYEESGVGFNHQVTAIMPAVHSQQIARWMPELPDLPEAVAQMVRDTDEAAVDLPVPSIANELIRAGRDDPGEPSLAVLGRGVEAWAALHAARRGQFVKHSLGMDASYEMAALEPVIAGYPLAPLIRTLAEPPGSPAADYADGLSDFVMVDGAGLGALYSIVYRLPNNVRLENMNVGRLKRMLRACRIQVEPDLHRTMTKRYSSKPKMLIYFSEQLSDVSRDSPVLISTNVRCRWDLFKNKLDKLHQQYPDYPSLNLAIAKGWLAHGDRGRAIEFYEKYTAQAPDPVALRSLAHAYFQEGDEDMWLATMNRIFQHEDYGLRHARAATAIAATLMHQGKHEEALPWAERGASSGASDTIAVHCDCLTVLGRHGEAEEQAIYNTQRYGMNYGHDDWYDWCAENGRGDLEGAWALKQRRLARHRPPDDRDHAFANTLHQLVTDRHAEARDTLAARLAEKFSPFDSIALAMLHDQLGEAEQRDAVLQKMIDLDPASLTNASPYFLDLAPILKEAADSGDVDHDRVAAAVKKYQEKSNVNLTGTYGLIVGWFLHNRDRDAEAIEHWKPAARYSKPNWERILAWKFLRGAGVDPTQIEGRYYRNQFWRPDAPAEDNSNEEAGQSISDEPQTDGGGRSGAAAESADAEARQAE